MPIYKLTSSKNGKQGYRVIVSFMDSSGKYKQIERRAYGAAKAKLLEKELLNELNNQSIYKNMTVQDLYDEYIKVKKHEVRESSLDKSVRTLEFHVLPTFRDVKLSKLTLPILQKWKLSMEEKTVAENGNKLSLITKQNVFGEFRALLNYGVKMEYIPSNPLPKVGNFKSSLAPKNEIDYYTPEEFLKFIEAARREALEAEKCGDLSEWHYFVFFAIAFYTGLRKGEINGLQWNDIGGVYLSVNRSIAQKLKGGDRETPPKNSSSIRTLQMPQPLIEILNEHKVRCKKIEGFNQSYKICGGIKPLRDSTIQKRNKLYSKIAGVKTIRIHDYRHSHASLLANEGINIQEIARRLGHSKIEITWNIYSHLYPKEEERAIKILDKIK